MNSNLQSSKRAFLLKNSVKKILSGEIHFNPPAKILVIDDSRLINYRELIARVKTQVLLSRMTAEKEKMLHFAMEEKRATVISQIAAGVSHNFSNSFFTCDPEHAR